MDLKQNEIYSSNPDDFELIKPIGYGSSATVYLAYYKPKNAKVAIKVIDMDMFERNQIDELRREIQVMSLCKHPNLLPVYCSYVHESKLYIVTPYLASGAILDILKYKFPEGLEEIYISSILKQTLLGLDYLHKNGHIHRDIKAGNLLLCKSGEVLLADFGVSSSLNDYFDRKKLRKTFVGTPCWMAPEVMEQSGYDHKADIWSLGITALELANGQAPLAKYPPIKVLMMTLSKEPPTLDRENSKNKYSKSFKEFIDLCLNKDPNKRPSAEKLLQHSFFKQVKKMNGLSYLAHDIPPIEDREIQQKAAVAVKLPAKGESWNFSPVVEHEDKDSYFKEHRKPSNKSDSPLPQLIENATSPSLKPTQSINFAKVVPPPAISTEAPKKSRFTFDALNTDNLQHKEGNLNPISNNTTLSSVMKGRFSVASEKSDNQILSPEPEIINQLPLTREASKSSRFSISSETENVSPVESIDPKSATTPTSISKRGRFQVTNEAGEVTKTPHKPDVDDEPDYSNTLLMHANQLDAILKQNESQRVLLAELQASLNSGNFPQNQLPNLTSTINEQLKANSKSECILNDSLLTFQHLTQKILQENTQLKASLDALNKKFEKMTIQQSDNPDDKQTEPFPQS